MYHIEMPTLMINNTMNKIKNKFVKVRKNSFTELRSY